MSEEYGANFITVTDDDGNEIELHENSEEENAKIRAAEDNIDPDMIGEEVNDMDDPLMDDEYQDTYETEDESDDYADDIDEM